MIEPSQASFGWCKMDLFWDGFIVLMMKPNQNLATIFRSLFSIGTPTSLNPRVVLEIIGANNICRLSRD